MGKTKILIFGAGAIGQYLAGCLSNENCQIYLIAKTRYLKVLNEKGLTIKEKNKVLWIKKIKAFSSLEEIPSEERNFDFILLTVKSYDAAACLEILRPYLSAKTKLVVFQNGIGSEELAATFMHSDKIISAALTTAVDMKESGFLEISSSGGVGLAPYLKNASVKKLYKLFKDSGLKVKIYKNYRSLKWSKLLLNIVGNASCAILQSKSGEAISNKHIFEIEKQSFKEAVLLMQKMKVWPVDLPDFPVSLLINLFFLLPDFILRPLLRSKLSKARGDKLPSLYLDMSNQKEHSEIESLNGAVVKVAKRYDLPVPANKVLYETLADIVAKKISEKSYSHKPEKLYERYLSLKEGKTN